ncbi:MAG: acetolactate synthase [Acutalibacter sp.]|jgi:hypothetical protein|nr:acetolactate synthase [Acutalibacter sp.]
MTVNQISVFLENKPGTLTAMTGLLAESGVDMRALSLAETNDFGIVRIIVDDVYKATTVLKDGGFIHQLTPVLAVLIPDEPGGLHKVLEVLREAEVNVEYMYAFLGGGDVNHAYMIFRVQDTKKAGAALAVKGIKLVNQDSIAEI